MNKKEQLYLYGAMVLTGVIAIALIYKKLNPSSGNTDSVNPSDEFNLQEAGAIKSDTFDPIKEAKNDGVFLSKVKLLQKKLNAKIKTTYPDFEYYPLVEDGLMGSKTTAAIVRVFGDRLMPILNKEQVNYFINNL